MGPGYYRHIQDTSGYQQSEKLQLGKKPSPIKAFSILSVILSKIKAAIPFANGYKELDCSFKWCYVNAVTIIIEITWALDYDNYDKLVCILTILHYVCL